MTRPLALGLGVGGALVAAGLVGLAVVVSRRGASVGDDGIVRWDNGKGPPADPNELREAAGVTLDVYALARMCASEASSEKAKTACAWAARNMAKARGRTIAAQLLRGRRGDGTPSSSDGYFGRQNTGKYASTAANPRAIDLEIAARVLSGVVPDPTGGATQFDAPTAQDSLLASATTNYTKTAEQIAAERVRGSDLVMVPGVTTVRFWRPKGAA